jgi:hypothetical protein
MKKEKLLNAVENIEDRFISEAEVYDPEKAKKHLSPGFFIIPAAAAASVALILGVNSMYDKHDPYGDPEVDNYTVSETSAADPVSSENYGYSGTETAAAETEISPGTGYDTSVTPVTEISAVETGTGTEVSKAAAVSSAKADETASPKKTEAPVTERQAAPETPARTEAAEAPHVKPEPPVSTEDHRKPDHPVTAEEQNPKPEPPSATAPDVNPEPPSTTAENEKETPEPPTTTEFVQPAPGLKPQPLSFGNYDEAIQAVNTYDLNDYAEYCKDAYEKMFGRIISDGFVYAPDDTENDLLNTEKSRVTILPYSAYEDIAVGCIAEYDTSQFQTTFCCADRDVLASCADQAEYFRNRLSQEFEISWQNSGREIFIKDIGVWHCAYAFIDDEHYYIIRTQDSEEALLRFVSNVSFKQIPLS